MKDGEIKIYYKGKPTENFDKEIEDFLKNYGYSFYASGMDLVERVRDLAFERKNTGSGTE